MRSGPFATGPARLALGKRRRTVAQVALMPNGMRASQAEPLNWISGDVLPVWYGCPRRDPVGYGREFAKHRAERVGR